jgi:hypothetical protein
MASTLHAKFDKEPSGFLEGRESVDQLSNCYLLVKTYALVIPSDVDFQPVASFCKCLEFESFLTY